MARILSLLGLASLVGLAMSETKLPKYTFHLVATVHGYPDIDLTPPIEGWAVERYPAVGDKESDAYLVLRDTLSRDRKPWQFHPIAEEGTVAAAPPGRYNPPWRVLLAYQPGDYRTTLQPLQLTAREAGTPMAIVDTFPAKRPRLQIMDHGQFYACHNPTFPEGMVQLFYRHVFLMALPKWCLDVDLIPRSSDPLKCPSPKRDGHSYCCEVQKGGVCHYFGVGPEFDG